VDDERYYTELAGAFARGRLALGGDVDDDTAIARGHDAGLRLHKFKRATLPRVHKVLGVLRGLAPASLVDIGSGRGTFLWPLVDAFPGLPVLAVDHAQRRVADIGAVKRGGLARISAARMDAERLALADKCADVVTALEVIEHLHHPERAAAEAVRVARRFVVVSVPSHEDDNPEHIQRFDRASLTRLLEAAGARKVSCDYVLNHIIALGRL